MKRIFCIVMLLCFGVSSLAQSFHFSDTSNKWKTFIWDGGNDRPCCFDSYSFSGDTIIGTVKYESLNGRLIREDTNTRKVYILSDTTEYLLYDFSLGLGDTLLTHFAAHYVSGLDSVLISGISHRIWSLKGFWKDSSTYYIDESLNNYSVVEGIGSLVSPLFPESPFSFEEFESLVCFENNGTKPVLSRALSYYFDNAGSCDRSFGVVVPLVNLVKTNVIVQPNPVTIDSKIVFPYQIKNGLLSIWSIDERAVCKISMYNLDDIIIGDNVSQQGMYFFSLVDLGSGKSFSGKFVKE